MTTETTTRQENKEARKHLIASNDLTRAEIDALIKQANAFLPYVQKKTENQKPRDLLAGKTILTLFAENSTRTKISFELAAKLLGATVINFDATTSSLKKGESLDDTIENLIAMGIDAIVLRHKSAGIHHQLVQRFGEQVCMINAGDGAHDHPTQGLLDCFTMHQVLDTLHDKKVVIVGDILHSRVARSNLHLLNCYGAKVHFVGPPPLMPKEITEVIPGGCLVHEQLSEALPNADIVMALRIQTERQESNSIASLADYSAMYRLTHQHLKQWCKPTVKLMHPGPVNRGVEVSTALIDDPAISLVLQQVTNGVAMRMAVLLRCLTE
ncbi:MAG: aspartate carbamoyltransferase catalytic subunit [Cyanobacteria bacterium P01_H01_bin.74]